MNSVAYWNDDDTYLEDRDWHRKLIDIPEITKNILTYLQNQSGMEKRDGQRAMSYDIAKSISMRENIMIEAGVGIGKSFAYLVPALLVQRRLSRPIVLVTSSIALSNQLMDDVQYASEQISKYIHEPFNVKPILAKGARNYVCKKRIADLIEKKRNIGKKKDKSLNNQEKSIKEYPNWILKSTDVKERSDFSKRLTNQEWNKICGKLCSNEKDKCPYKWQCYYYRMRKSIDNNGDAKVIIINMDMFIVHLKLLRKRGHGLLNENAALYVIDEAHNLEDKTRSVLTVLKTESDIIKIMDNMKSVLQRKYNGALEEEIGQSIDNMKKNIKHIFGGEAQIVKEYKAEDVRHEESTKFIPLKNKKLTNEVIRAWIRFLKNMYDKIDVYNAYLYKRDKTTEDIEELILLLESFLPESNNILWFQQDDETGNRLAMCTAPKNIDEILNNMLFRDRLIPKILTSATLCQNNLQDTHAYDYQKATIGFDGNLGKPQKSPFNYDENAIMYLPNDISSPSDNHEKYLAEISERINQLADITKGRTLCLFTSKKDMEYVHNYLIKLQTKWWVINQSSNMSQEKIIDKFRGSKGILLATGLWEGFNIKGSDISSVIIVKLPFPVPDPIVNYKVTLYNDKLSEVTIPEMLRKLRQGIGRLIRSNEDKGILSILDSRMERYQKNVIDVSPIKKVVTDLEGVRAFTKGKLGS